MRRDSVTHLAACIPNLFLCTRSMFFPLKGVSGRVESQRAADKLLVQKIKNKTKTQPPSQASLLPLILEDEMNSFQLIGEIFSLNFEHICLDYGHFVKRTSAVGRGENKVLLARRPFFCFSSRSVFRSNI